MFEPSREDPASSPTRERVSRLLKAARRFRLGQLTRAEFDKLPAHKQAVYAVEHGTPRPELSSATKARNRAHRKVRQALAKKGRRAARGRK